MIDNDDRKSESLPCFLENLFSPIFIQSAPKILILYSWLSAEGMSQFVNQDILISSKSIIHYLIVTQESPSLLHPAISLKRPTQRGKVGRDGIMDWSNGNWHGWSGGPRDSLGFRSDWIFIATYRKPRTGFEVRLALLICEIFVCYEKKMKGDAGVQNTDRISL